MAGRWRAGRWRRLAGILAFAAVLACGSGPALAQQHAAPAAAPTLKAAPIAKPEAAPSRAEIESLVRTLEDDQARAHLIAQLKALIAVQEKKPARLGLGARLIADISDRIEAIGQGFVQVGEQISRPDLFLTWLEQQVHSPSRRLFWARVFAILAGALAAALAAGFVIRRILARPRRAIEARSYPNPLGRLMAALLRALLDCVPIAAFAGAGYGVLTLTGPGRLVRLVALAVLNAAILVQLVVAGCRLALAPLATSLRVIPMRDEAAAYTYIWVRRFAIVAIYGYFAGQLSLLVRLSEAGHQAIVKLIGGLVAIMMAILILQMRPRIAEFIRGRPDVRARFGAVRGRLADIWHILATTLVFAAYFTWALAVRGGAAFLLRGLIGTAIVVVAARLLVALEHRLLDQLFAVSADFRARYPTLEERASRYVPIVRGLVTTLVVVVAVVFALQVWGIDSIRALASPMGRAVALGLLRILVIVAVAVAVIEGIGLAVARYLHSPDADGLIRERSARARTLLPLLRSVLVIVVGTIAAISVLSQFGVDIAPLIAGVGIFGLAVGFGAQSLVKDVITGAFILFEDTIAVGDVIELGRHSGTVEALSIRSVRLRDVSGHVHTVPFGTIDAVVNSTRDFAYYVGDIGIAYREDTDAVAAILAEVVEGMRGEDAFARSILAPLEVMGVQSLAESAVVLRVRIRTLPADQWRIGREFNRRLKKAFDAHDVEIPFPTRTLYFGVAKDGTAPPVHVALSDAPPPAEAARPDPDAPPRSDAGDGGDGDGNGRAA